MRWARMLKDKAVRENWRPYLGEEGKKKEECPIRTPAATKKKLEQNGRHWLDCSASAKKYERGEGEKQAVSKKEKASDTLARQKAKKKPSREKKVNNTVMVNAGLGKAERDQLGITGTSDGKK